MYISMITIASEIRKHRQAIDRGHDCRGHAGKGSRTAAATTNTNACESVRPTRP